MMKKLLSVTAVFMIFLVGCSEQVNINSPENLVNAQEPNWITLPKSEYLRFAGQRRQVTATGGDGFPTSQPFSQEHLREYRLRAPNQRLSGKS